MDRADLNGTDDNGAEGAAAPAESGILARKVRAAQAEQQARAMSALKALRVTLAKVAEDLFELPAAVIGIRGEERSGDTLADLLEDPALLLILDGTQGARGGAIIDPVLVGGLIQQQTMGRVLEHPEGPLRAMTPTDAAICAPLIDAHLYRAAQLPDLPADRQVLEGWQFGVRAPEPRVLLLALDASLDYRVFHITVELGRGIRQGTITLCLPVPEAPRPAPKKDQPQDAASFAEGRTLEQNVLDLTCALPVSLARVKLSLSAVGKLRPGDTIPLGAASFESATVSSEEGRRLSRGVLGQIGGKRAVRLTHRIVPESPQRREEDRGSLDLPELAPILPDRAPDPTAD